MGTFVCRLFEKESPRTVANFVGLATGAKEWQDPGANAWKKSRFYDGLLFHRVVADYIIQGGDPKGDGTGGPGYSFEDEINGLRFDRPGRLAMANAGPNSNGSQFFVTVVPAEDLNDKKDQAGKVSSHFTIFGQVVDGQKVVDAVSRVPAEQERPVRPVVLNRLEILRVDRKGGHSVLGARDGAALVEALEGGEIEQAGNSPEPMEKAAPKKAKKKKSADSR